MERKRENKNGSLYLMICSCLVIMAMVGFAGRMSLKEKTKDAPPPVAEVTPEPKAEQTAQKKEVEVPDEEPKTEAKAEEKQEEKQGPEVIVFTAPVSGKVIEGYMGDDLVYNESLKDWRTHKGVDFEAELGETVKASGHGIVEKVFDSGMGRCVIIDHQNGYKTMYANLEESTPVKEGDEVKAGDVIGKVGNTALGDMTDQPHLHFEMLKDEIHINPTEMLN